MKKTGLILLITAMILTACKPKEEKISYPETKKVDTTDIYFGVSIADPYRWLEDDNSAETAEWVKAENVVTDNYLAKIPFREELKSRLTEIMDYPKYGSPFKKAGKYFFFKNDGLQNQSVLYVQDSLISEPKILLDPNTLSADGTTALGGIYISKDGKFLGYSISKAGSDWSELFVKNIETGETLADHIKWVKFSGMSWKGDGFYYSAYDAPKEGGALSNVNEYQKVFYHKIGDNQSQDILVFEDNKNPLRNSGVSVDDDQKYLFLSQTESTSGNSLSFKEIANTKGGFTTIVDNFDSDNNIIEVIDGKFLMVTTKDAPNKRVVLVDPKNPAADKWITIIPEDKNVLSSVDLIGGKIVTTYLQDASSHSYVNDMTGKRLYEIEFPAIGTVGGFSGDKDEKEAFYVFTSFTFPSTIYRYNVETNKSELYRKSEVKFNPEDFETEQVFFTSKDGTKVPMFLTYKKGLKKDGNNPTLVYGYGGFDISLTPSFSVSRIPFLENGGIYAMVNLRGGGEYGKEWHTAGTKMQKQNVFDDFISATEYLIKEKYTNPQKVAINGGSNGGLLVGACMLQRPDLFKVAVPAVGVLDMLRYHKFTIGWAWATDYGTSADSKEMFDYLLKYSPLHNVKEGVEYPATLIMTADHDDRVVPAHSFKFAAELQAKQSGTNPILIRIESNAGHGAGKPTAKVIDEQTDMWAFIMSNLGMNFKK